MAYILVQFPVEDYGKWKRVFEAHETTRRTAGSKGGTALRNAEDPNHVTTLLEWDSLENAKAFASSDTLREAMQEAGVKGPPAVFLFEETFKPSA